MIKDISINFGQAVTTPYYQLMAADGTLGANITAGFLHVVNGIYFLSQVDVGASRGIYWNCVEDIEGFDLLNADIQLAAIKAKTDTITTNGITVVSPVNNAGTIVTIIAFDSYKAADGRAIEFSNDDWPDLTGATVTLRLAGLKNFLFTVSDASTVTRDFTSAETGMLAVNVYDFVLHAVLANGDELTLTGGKQVNSQGFVVLSNIPAAP